MWTILSIIAIISLIIFFPRGPNAIWGGATGGLIIGVIVALMREGFPLPIVGKGVVIGVIAGVLAQIIGLLSRRLEK